MGKTLMYFLMVITVLLGFTTLHSTVNFEISLLSLLLFIVTVIFYIWYRRVKEKVERIYYVNLGKKEIEDVRKG